MAIRPIDTEDEYYEEEGLPTAHVFKSILLLVIIISGIAFGYFYNENKHRISTEMVKAGIRPTGKPSPMPFKPNAAYNPDVDSTLEDLRDESGKMVGDGVASAVGAGSDILGAAAASVSETVNDSVTKNVTKQVQDTAASSTQAVTNTLYKSTVGQVILQLFNQLPPPAKKEVMKDLIKQLTPTKEPSPTPDADFDLP